MRVGGARRVPAWLVGGLLALVAGCGGDGGDLVLVGGQPVEGYEDPAGLRLAPSRSLGFGLAGDDITAPGPTIRVPVGEEVTVTFRNDDYTDGGLPRGSHNFAVVAEDDPNAEEPLWGSSTAALEAGEEETVTFTPDTPGTYVFVCTVRGHWGRGMYGEFVVEG